MKPGEQMSRTSCAGCSHPVSFRRTTSPARLPVSSCTAAVNPDASAQGIRLEQKSVTYLFVAIVIECAGKPKCARMSRNTKCITGVSICCECFQTAQGFQARALVED